MNQQAQDDFTLDLSTAKKGERAEHKTGCLLCGHELVYLEEPRAMRCVYCEQEVLTGVMCTDEHFVCDRCHALGAIELIEMRTVVYAGVDPVELAIQLMADPRVKMHGPEHHFLTPAVLLSAYYNAVGDPDMKVRKIAQAKERAMRIPGGFCGTHGNCGAAVGSGIFISLVTKATPLSDEPWRLSNLMTARSLFKIANNGGPRCCKRDTFLAISEACDFISEQFDVQLSTPGQIVCDFSSFNRECRMEQCLYYGSNH